jgi:hypothetical protein
VAPQHPDKAGEEAVAFKIFLVQDRCGPVAFNVRQGEQPTAYTDCCAEEEESLGGIKKEMIWLMETCMACFVHCECTIIVVRIEVCTTCSSGAS